MGDPHDHQWQRGVQLWDELKRNYTKCRFKSGVKAERWDRKRLKLLKELQDLLNPSYEDRVGFGVLPVQQHFMMEQGDPDPFLTQDQNGDVDMHMDDHMTADPVVQDDSEVKPVLRVPARPTTPRIRNRLPPAEMKSPEERLADIISPFKHSLNRARKESLKSVACSLERQFDDEYKEKSIDPDPPLEPFYQYWGYLSHEGCYKKRDEQFYVLRDFNVEKNVLERHKYVHVRDLNPTSMTTKDSTNYTCDCYMGKADRLSLCLHKEIIVKQTLNFRLAKKWNPDGQSRGQCSHI